MIGQGRYRSLSADLLHPRVPHGPKASVFSEQLRKRCGAILVWNAQRRVFCVLKKRGDHAPMVSYFDITRNDLPFSSGLLRQCSNAVRYYNARMAGDPVRMMEELRRVSRDRYETERNQIVEDFTPEFLKDMKRASEILSDGRYRPKFFDMAGNKRLRASA